MTKESTQKQHRPPCSIFNALETQNYTFWSNYKNKDCDFILKLFLLVLHASLWNCFLLFILVQVAIFDRVKFLNWWRMIANWKLKPIPSRRPSRYTEDGRLEISASALFSEHSNQIQNAKYQIPNWQKQKQKTKNKMHPLSHEKKHVQLQSGFICNVKHNK